MARVLLCWELGEGWSYLLSLRSLAERLVGSGHRVSLALPTLDDAVRARFDGLSVRLLQGPSAGVRPLERTPTGYADLLLQHGFAEADALGSRLEAWQRIFAEVRPEALVFNAAPTAQIASRDLESYRVAYGVGYWVPPDSAPLPPLRTWVDGEGERAAASEARVLDVLRPSLARAGLRTGGAGLADLLRVHRTFVRSFQELDHYGQRAGATYLGADFALDHGVHPSWPGGSAPRIFGYLKRDSPFLSTLVRDLPRVNARVIACVPGTSEVQRQRWSTQNVRFTAEPQRLRGALAEADLVLTHGAAMVGACLVHGVPAVVLPATLEQLLTARRARAIRAVRVPRQAPPALDGAALVADALADEEIRRNAQAFAAHYAGYDPSTGEATLTEAIDRALG
ncbi:MAG: hypothetical protein EA397_18065 [Deltaproteobacteria bacterium]|nr:MAG: hypothetical protein EA397_18065 [Deltaproteobacteria bacterium]